MGVLDELSEAINNLKDDRDSKERDLHEAIYELEKLRRLVRELKPKVAKLKEQRDISRVPPIRGAFWKSIDEVTDHLNDLENLLVG